jgi:hypothetical protein
VSDRFPQLAPLADLLAAHYGDTHRPLHIRGWVGIRWWACPVCPGDLVSRPLATTESGGFTFSYCAHDEQAIRAALGAVVA